MARRWRLNPPPNWPAMPDDWEPGHDWSPEPEWGPAPVGWTLWRRERRAAWLLRHRRSAGLGSAAVLTIFVALAGPPTSGTFEQPGAGAAIGSSPTAPAARRPADRPGAEPGVRMQRRTPEATRVRRPATIRVVSTTEPTFAPSHLPHERRAPARWPGPAPSRSTRSCPPAESPAPGMASVTPTPRATGTAGTAGAGGAVRVAGADGARPASRASLCPGGGDPAPTTSGSPEPSG